MAGDGPLRRAAESLARELGVAERIVFSGWWDDVAGLLAATDVSVLTSRHEGLPCSVVESLAAGVPVVVTAVDGTIEVVRPDDNGYLVAAGDIVALADAVTRLLRDADLRERMGAAARRGLQQFDRDLMVRQQGELYRWVISNNRS
jgi:glycosyltransferase involved in cell wall biosynthesis